MSLKLAIERLIGEPCYHMLEVFVRPDHVKVWHEAIKGEPVDWATLFDGFGAIVDWPGCTFWRELADANPDALIILSTRDDSQAWYRSADRTIFELFKQDPPSEPDAWRDMATDLLRRFTPGFLDPSEAMAAYDRWNADVRATADPARFLEWRPGDGWEPICAALGVDVPDEPFPHANTTEEFRTRAGWE
jgi:hypothetical protein